MQDSASRLCTLCRMCRICRIVYCWRSVPLPCGQYMAIFNLDLSVPSCTHCNRRTRIMVFEIAFKQKRVVDWLFAGQLYVYVEDIAKEKVVGLYVALGQLYLIGWCGNQINWLNLKSLHLSIFVPLTLATDGECNTWSNISLNFSFFTPMQLGWGFKGHNKDTTCIGT